MSKIEFMKALEELLLDIPVEERTEALKYYEGYFEDAGTEREQDILDELGSPDKIAASIKADLGSSGQEAQNRGYFTEKGYEDDAFKEPRYEMLDGTAGRETDADYEAGGHYRNSRTDTDYSTGSEDYGNQGKRRKKSESRTGLIILLCILAIPVGIPLVATVFSLFIGAFCTVAGICIAFAVISFTFTIIGFCLAVAGFIKLVTIPFIGMLLAGAGLILFGLGLLFTIATIGLYTKAIPAVFRFFTDICRLPFRNRRVTA